MAELKSDIIFWKEALKDLPSSYKAWFKEEKEFLRKNVDSKTKLLDVACGDGKGLKMVSDIIKEGVGLDFDENALKDAKNNFKDSSNIKFVLGDAESLPFEENSFDVVICIGSLCNAGDKKVRWLEEMGRVSKKNGSIILSVYSEDAFDERIKFYKKLKVPIKKIEGTKVFLDDKEIKDNTSEQFSKKDLEELFSKSKLELIGIVKSGIGYICKARKL